MAKSFIPYRTYVIRCWEEQSVQTNSSIYRFTLEIPAIGKRCEFTSSEKLMNALKLALSQIQAISDRTPEDYSD